MMMRSEKKKTRASFQEENKFFVTAANIQLSKFRFKGLKLVP